ncbi:unnamed protein product [Cyprideis torosa]|uniref:Uncharacterized protein n=1 Tax=Cyprideis torosa TaxID=163714 RepID=A0A7R8W5N5_9CRUS|nr:unnamed protein product [Cyprideis torosa]CAG0885495.1 unnamed protein product [Cyprideis torosa]
MMERSSISGGGLQHHRRQKRSFDVAFLSSSSDSLSSQAEKVSHSFSPPSLPTPPASSAVTNSKSAFTKVSRVEHHHRPPLSPASSPPSFALDRAAVPMEGTPPPGFTLLSPFLLNSQFAYLTPDFQNSMAPLLLGPYPSVETFRKMSSHFSPPQLPPAPPLPTSFPPLRPPPPPLSSTAVSPPLPPTPVASPPSAPPLLDPTALLKISTSSSVIAPPSHSPGDDAGDAPTPASSSASETSPKEVAPVAFPSFSSALACFTLTAQNTCAECSLTFRMTSDLVYHMRTHHMSTKRPAKRRDEKLKCPICFETFRERHHLTRHMTAHNDKENDGV